MRIQVQGKKKCEIWKFVFIPCWKKTKRDFETFFLGIKPKKRAILRIAVLEALM